MKLFLALLVSMLHVSNGANIGYCPKKVPLTVSGQSSVFENNDAYWGAHWALSEVSSTSTKFWHSNYNDSNPWIAFKMPSTNDVIAVQVIDRQDCCQNRFKNVEVTVGSSPDINQPGRKSCGIRSHNGSSTTYKFYCPQGTNGKYIFIQKPGPQFFNVNHVAVLVKGGSCPLGREVQKTLIRAHSDGGSGSINSASVTIDCKKCDKFFDKFFHEDFEVKHNEVKSKNAKHGVAHAEYTETKVSRDKTNIIGHDVSAGVGGIEVSAGHKQEAGLLKDRHKNKTTGVYVGSTGNVGVGLKNPVLKEDITAEANYDINAETNKLGVKAGASVGVDVNTKIGKAKVGVGYHAGLGGQVGYSQKDRNVGASATTPVGSFGAKFGCVNEICIFGCVKVKVC